MKPQALPVTLFMVFLGVSTASADMQADLKAGKILVSSAMGTDIKPGQATAMIEAPAELVEQVLLDFEHYQDFVPRITESRRVKEMRYVLHAEFPWPVNKTWAYLNVTKQKRKNTRYVRWTMLNGTLKRFEGMAWIQPWGKDRCLLTYQMLVVPKVLAPDGRITRGLRNAVKSMVKALRQRVAWARARVSEVRVATQ